MLTVDATPQIVANAQASLVRIDRVTSTTSHGSGALISATGENGLIEVLGSTADQFLLRGNKGSVKVSNVTVHDTLKVRGSHVQRGCLSVVILLLRVDSVAVVPTLLCVRLLLSLAMSSFPAPALPCVAVCKSKRLLAQ